MKQPKPHRQPQARKQPKPPKPQHGHKGGGGSPGAQAHHQRAAARQQQRRAAKKPAGRTPKASRKPRQLALGAAVACCSVEALAASARLAGWPVGDDDVLALYRAVAADDEAGVSILAALTGAAEHGLAGVRPVSFGRTLALAPGVLLGVELPGAHTVTFAPDGCWLSWGEHYDPSDWPDAVIEEAWAVTWP